MGDSDFDSLSEWMKINDVPGWEERIKADKQAQDNPGPGISWTAFFDQLFGGLRKEFVTKKMFINYNGEWRVAVNHEHLIKAKARAAGLKPALFFEQLALYQHKYQGKDFLIPIQEWDGEDRISQVLSHMKLKNFTHEQFVEIFKDWCVKMIGRAHDSTVQNRCLIFKGDQGKGKDTFIRSIFGHLDRYYGKYTNSNHQEKDQWELVATKILVHVEEFEQTNKMSVAFFKNLISADKADFRPPYARDTDTFKCVASFISSSNIDNMLRDTTGNRRFVVFDVDSIDWSYPKNWSKDIIAQIFHMWRTDWKPSMDVKEIVTESLKEFEPVNTDEILIEEWNMKVIELLKKHSTIWLHSNQVMPLVSELAKNYRLSNIYVQTVLKAYSASKRHEEGMRYAASGYFKK